MSKHPWHSKHKGNEPPHLTFENFGVVKNKQLIDLRIAQIIKQCNKKCSKRHIQHQVGNSLIPIAQAKTVKAIA